MPYPLPASTVNRDELVRRALPELRDFDKTVSPAVIQLVRSVFFPGYPPPDRPIDFCLVLGSQNCGYRVQAAFDLCKNQFTRYILTGGSRTGTGESEAIYMRSQLISWGVGTERIFCNTTAACTFENLEHSRPLIESLLPAATSAHLVLVTAGFHLVRTLALARGVFAVLSRVKISPFPAYGPHTGSDTWHLHQPGRAVIADEWEKLVRMGLITGSR